MHQHTLGTSEIGVALDDQEMETLTGGDAALWQGIGMAIGYIAGQIADACAVVQHPVTVALVYQL
jgi:hypothetical protein